jgi:single-strand DNA-binding protein
MNKVMLMGRLTRDPEVRYATDGRENLCVAKYTLAVDRRGRKNGDGSDQPSADFIRCTSFGKQGEFAEKYLRQGMKMMITGRIQTGSYTNREGQKVYTTDVIVEDQEFAESKSASENRGSNPQPGYGGYQNKGNGASKYGDMVGPDGFMTIPDGVEDDLPFV